MNCAEPDGFISDFGAFCVAAGGLEGGLDGALGAVLCAAAVPIMRPVRAVVIISFFNMWSLHSSGEMVSLCQVTREPRVVFRTLRLRKIGAGFLVSGWGTFF